MDLSPTSSIEMNYEIMDKSLKLCPNKIFLLNRSQSKDWRLHSNDHEIFYTNMTSETTTLFGNGHPLGSSSCEDLSMPSKTTI